jgi:hypothetical protein
MGGQIRCRWRVRRRIRTRPGRMPIMRSCRRVGLALVVVSDNGRPGCWNSLGYGTVGLESWHHLVTTVRLFLVWRCAQFQGHCVCEFSCIEERSASAEGQTDRMQALQRSSSINGPPYPNNLCCGNPHQSSLSHTKRTNGV